MARLLSILFCFFPFAFLATAQTPVSRDFVLFLEEKFPLVAEDSKVPAEALPDMVVRCSLDSKSLFLVFDCDTRNLNPPVAEAAPYTLGITLGSTEAAPITLALNGSNSPDEVALNVLAMVGAASPPPTLPPGWDKVTAKQSLRQDGSCRVQIEIPRELLEKNNWMDSFRFQANWRQLTGVSETGDPQYLPGGGMVLALPNQSVSLILRTPLPGDIAPMLAMLAAARDPRCADRCIRRLLWVGRKDEALRGALVMALEHADPALRAAAAKVWLEWSAPDTPGLPELKAKAKMILAAPAH